MDKRPTAPKVIGLVPIPGKDSLVPADAKGQINIIPESASVKKPKAEATPTGKGHLRAAGGKIWTDETLTDWSPTDHRVFVGDLGPEVDDAMLRSAFSAYPSLTQVRVVRDRRTGKSRGFGFVALARTEDYQRAMREMAGRYVGSRPVRLRKGQWREREVEGGEEAVNELKSIGYRVVPKRE